MQLTSSVVLLFRKFLRIRENFISGEAVLSRVSKSAYETVEPDLENIE